MLTSVKIENFKAFRFQEIPLAPLTMLSGLNGSGKSTFMQALAMLRQSSETGFLENGEWLLNGSLVELGNGSDVLHEDPDRNEIKISLTANTSTNEDLEHSWSVRHSRESDVLAPISEKIESKTSEMNLNSIIDSIVKKEIKRIFPAEKIKLAKMNLFSNGFQYVRADRINPAVTYPKSDHAVNALRFLGRCGEFTPHFLLRNRDANINSPKLLRKADGGSDKLLSQVNAWMQDFSPGVVIDIQNVPNTDLVRLEYAYRGRGLATGNKFRATNVGFGLTYSLPIVVACLASEPGSLVLIENPEAHLHPSGQVAMGKLMALAASIGVQILLETHSDHVLNGIRLAVKGDDILPKSLSQ